MSRRKPTRAQTLEHHGVICTPLQGQRIMRGQLESTPQEYKPAIGSCKARREIEARREARQSSQSEWYAL